MQNNTHTELGFCVFEERERQADRQNSEVTSALDTDKEATK